MDIPKALVADSAELLIWAQGKVGEMLGETSPGKRHDKEPSPPGESLDRNARHRYRDMARIDETELSTYLADARGKYLADDARIAVFSPRAVHPQALAEHHRQVDRLRPAPPRPPAGCSGRPAGRAGQRHRGA